MTHEMTDQNRRALARRIAYTADRDLSTAFAQIEELVRLSPQHTAELRQMTYAIARMQGRVLEIAETVQ